MEERRQERDRKHEERMQSQFFTVFQMIDGRWMGPCTTTAAVSTCGQPANPANVSTIPCISTCQYHSMARATH